MMGYWKAGVVAAIFCLAWQTPSRAAEYSLQSQIQLGALANDNIRLSTTNEEEVAGAVLSPQLTFGYRTEATDISLMSRADFNGYVVNSDLSSIDNLVAFHSGFRSERGYLALDADYNRDTIFENVEDNDVEILEKARVATISVSPSYTYQLTPIDRLNLEAGFRDRDYSSGSEDLVDYRYYNAGIDLAHDVTEIDTFIAGTSYGHFDPDSSEDEESDVVNLQLGWLREFSPRLRVRLAGGPSWISTGDDQDIGYNADARISYDFDERTVFTATYTLRTEPSSGGEVTRNRSRLSASVEHRLTELLTLRFASSFVGKETGNTGDTSSFSLQPSMVWRLSETTDLTASYQFRHKTEDDPNEEASSNAIFVSVIYRPTRWAWSD